MDQDYGDVAERFCKREGLSKAYLEQIRGWLLKQCPPTKQAKEVSQSQQAVSGYKSALFPHY
jgi:hypothetical protein